MIHLLRLKFHSARLAVPATMLLLLLQRTPVLRTLVQADFFSGARLGQLLRAILPAAFAAGATHTLTGATQWTTNPTSPVNGQVGTSLTVVFAFTGGSATPESYSIVGTLPPGLSVPSATGPTGNLTLNSTTGGSISGVPTGSGAFSVTLTAFDAPDRGLGENGSSPPTTLQFVIQSNTPPPGFTTHPLTQAVTEGGSVTFTVAASGSPTFQWRHGNNPLPGQTGTSLTLDPVTATHAGTYDCVATNAGGSVASNAATLTVNTLPVFTTHPQHQMIDYGDDVTFTAAATGIPAPTLQWRKDGTPINGATGGTLTLTDLMVEDGGNYDCLATNAAGSVPSNFAQLMVHLPPGPVITTQPVPITVRQDSGAFFSTIATGIDVTYQWRRDDVDLPGETSSSLFLSNVTGAAEGDYSVRVTNPGGSVVSTAVPLTVATTGSVRLVNLSARALVGTGGNILIPGFVVGGSGTKNVLMRSVGPRLGDFGVPGVLADPTMQVFLGNTGADSNDDWAQFADQTLLETTRTAVGAFDLTSPTQPARDSAMVVSLNPGSYTVQTSGVGGTTGVALVELFDADPSPASARFVNISARAQVGTGGDVLIPGFFIDGDVALTLLIRGVGPTLTGFGVVGALEDPVMTLLRITDNPTPGAQEVMTINDDWQQNPNVAALEGARVATSGFELDDGSADAALLVTLNPGGYTVKVEGKDGTTGVALMEIYLVGP